MSGFVYKEGFWFAPAIDPFDEKDYTLDLTGDLNGDTIPDVSNVVWSVLPASGITVVTAKNTVTTNSATVWLKSAAVNNEFLISAKVTTAAGRKFKKSFKVQVKSL